MDFNKYFFHSLTNYEVQFSEIVTLGGITVYKKKINF